MAKDFISDEEMASLDSPDFIPDEPAESPGIGQQIKQYAEDNIIDQLPGLGATAGGIGGGIVGNVPGALMGAGGGAYLGEAAKNMYNTYMRPEKAPKSAMEYMSRPIEEGVKGAGYEAMGRGVGAMIDKAVKPASGKVFDYLKNKAEKLKVQSTGATGVQARDFKPGTGRFLLDNKIGGFFSDPAAVAESSARAKEKAGQGIANILEKQLPEGTSVDRNKILNAIEARIQDLAGDESQMELRNKLKSIASDITETGVISGAEVPISKAEQIKRGFQGKVNWKTAAPDTVANNANAAVSDAYRQAVEDSATAANPQLANQFKAEKEAFGYLSPVEEAAGKRALTLQQSPTGGLLDIAASGAGGSVGATIGGGLGAAIGVPAGYALKAMRPRYASMGAHSADFLASVIKNSPDSLGQYAAPLAQALARSPESALVLDNILRGDPEYAERMNQLEQAGQ